MKTYNLKLCTLLFILGSSIGVYSQQVISSSGGNTERSDISIDWTIGESIISSVEETTVNLTQGFHQPVTICDPCLELQIFDVESQTANTFDEGSLLVYPNPVFHQLNLEAKIPESGTWYFAFYDASGKLIRMDKQIFDSEQTLSRAIDVSSFQSGQNFVRIFKGNYSLTKSFFKSH